ncbi:uncharacterized protein IL334_002517 [Kwoniella shivajii]|uniref:Uncharacterized protein n=1 Tax=Kwoniella shivajii TaxID=564305 RepID=A0ABZ1CUY6_9TREE|nr:hypothetical protein IL334_002517 [Kwoniella shivajii]
MAEDDYSAYQPHPSSRGNSRRPSRRSSPEQNTHKEPTCYAPAPSAHRNNYSDSYGPPTDADNYGLAEYQHLPPTEPSGVTYVYPDPAMQSHPGTGPPANPHTHADFAAFQGYRSDEGAHRGLAGRGPVYNLGERPDSQNIQGFYHGNSDPSALRLHESDPHGSGPAFMFTAPCDATENEHGTPFSNPSPSPRLRAVDYSPRTGLQSSGSSEERRRRSRTPRRYFGSGTNPDQPFGLFLNVPGKIDFERITRDETRRATHDEPAEKDPPYAPSNKEHPSPDSRRPSSRGSQSDLYRRSPSRDGRSTARSAVSSDAIFTVVDEHGRTHVIQVPRGEHSEVTLRGCLNPSRSTSAVSGESATQMQDDNIGKERKTDTWEPAGPPSPGLSHEGSQHPYKAASDRENPSGNRRRRGRSPGLGRKSEEQQFSGFHPPHDRDSYGKNNFPLDPGPLAPPTNSPSESGGRKGRQSHGRVDESDQSSENTDKPYSVELELASSWVPK